MWALLVKGYGIALVKALVAVTPGRLKAHIKPQNIASRKIAEAVGMTLDGETEEMCFYGLIPPDYVYDHLAVLRHL